jgi:thioredoxin-like negative regulator of GroEL
MPRRPPHTRPSKLPVRWRYKASKRNCDGNWLTKKQVLDRTRTSQEPAKNQEDKVRAPAVVTGRGQQVEVISHGAPVDITKHLVLGHVTVVDFYADSCGPCRQLSPRLEQMARTDPEIALRKIDIVNWKTPVVKQYNIRSIPQVNIYNRCGRLVGTVVGTDIQKIKRYVAQAKTSG